MIKLRSRKWRQRSIALFIVLAFIMMYSENKVKIASEIAENGHAQVQSVQLILKTQSDSPTKRDQIWPWGGEKSIERCAQRDWYHLGQLPNASIVITFLDNEVLSVLLRTVVTIIQNSPAHLLAEIILVGDDCKRDDLHEVLDFYTKTIPGGDKVHIVHSHIHMGLSKARLLGARKAKGQVIVFLDSHVEVQPNWLEPLLYEIKANRKMLTSPFIDWLHLNDTSGRWKHTHSAVNWVTFFDISSSWGFKIMERNEADLRHQGKLDITQPVRSPMTMGNFAIDKSFFIEIGEYDEGMEFWGGDNLDIAIRTWLFGGKVANIPCSKIAHAEMNNARSYRYNRDKEIFRNYKRTLAVWADDYLPYFEQYKPIMKNIDTGDLSSRLLIKQRAKYNFTYFLENIYPEFGIAQVHGLAWGQLQNVGTGSCLAVQDPKVFLDSCDKHPNNNDFYWSRTKHWIRSPFVLLNVRKHDVSNPLVTEDYMEMYNNPNITTWIHWKNGPFRVKNTDLCLAVSQDGKNAELAKCELNQSRQQWRFTEYPKQYQQERLLLNKQYKEKYIKQIESLYIY